jgi:nucleoside-diphosphate-sugar epimerase
MESSLKVLFAGCGDIGLRTIRCLQSRQKAYAWQTLAMRRRIEELPSDVDVVAGDLRDIDGLRRLLEGSQISALVVTLTPDHMSDGGYRDSYVAAAQAIKQVIAQTTQPPGLVVWVSSSGVYGQNDGEWVDELTKASPTSFRGKRLLEAEKIIHELPTASVVVRFSGIYGPGRSRLIDQVKRGNIAPPAPAHWTNRIHSEDCAGVIAHLLDKFCQDESLDTLYLATDNEPVPAHEMQCWLANQLGVEVGIEPSSQEVKSASRSGNRRCSNRRLRESGYQFLFPTFREGYQSMLGESSE